MFRLIKLQETSDGDWLMGGGDGKVYFVVRHVANYIEEHYPNMDTELRVFRMPYINPSYVDVHIPQISNLVARPYTDEEVMKTFMSDHKLTDNVVTVTPRTWQIAGETIDAAFSEELMTWVVVDKQTHA